MSESCKVFIFTLRRRDTTFHYRKRSFFFSKHAQKSQGGWITDLPPLCRETLVTMATVKLEIFGGLVINLQKPGKI